MKGLNEGVQISDCEIANDATLQTDSKIKVLQEILS